MESEYEKFARDYSRSEPREHLLDPRGLIEAVRNPAEPRPAEVYTRYEEIPGGWRCYLRIPMLAEAAETYGDNTERLYGEGPTREAAREVALAYLREQMRNAQHITKRLKVEDAMRNRRAKR